MKTSYQSVLERRWLSRSFLACMALVLSGFGVRTLHADEPAPGNASVVVDDPDNDASLCYVLSGCLNRDHQLIVIRDTVFAGQPESKLTGISFFTDESSSFDHFFSRVLIYIGYSLNDPSDVDNLDPRFNANFISGTRHLVFDDELLLQADADSEMHIDFNQGLQDSGGDYYFPLRPEAGRHLAIEIITSGEGWGDGTQFLDATESDDSATVTYEPTNKNSRRAGTFDSATGTPESIAPVVKLDFNYDPTSLTTHAYPGQNSVLNSSFYLLQAIKPIPEDLESIVDVDACAFRDPRDTYDQDGNLINSQQIPLPWSQVVLIDPVNCSWVHELLGRIDSTHRGFKGQLPDPWGWGTYAVSVRQTHSRSFGAYSAGDGELQSYLVDVFGVDLDEDLDCEQDAGGTRNLDQVPQIFIAPQDEGPNADDYSGEVQCDLGRSLQPRTITWFPGRFAHNNANYYNNLVQEQIHRARDAINAAGLCGDPDAVIADMSNLLSGVHDLFSHGDYSDEVQGDGAVQLAEELAWVAQNETFPDCAIAPEDSPAIITAFALQIAFAIWDNFAYADEYKCYQPVTRDPSGATHEIVGFYDCSLKD